MTYDACVKNKMKYGIFYINETTKEKVAFKHALPIEFDKDQSEQFIKDMNLEKWRGGGTPLPKNWIIKSLPLTSSTE